MVKVRKDVFEARENDLVTELNKTLAVIVSIHDKAVIRITTATQRGRDMTAAKAALAISDIKIATARLAIAGISTSTLSTSGTASTTASTTIDVDLKKPRELNQAAIKAVQEAKKSVNEVIVAIAHSMGYRVGLDGKVIATSTTATSTATSTQ